MNEFSDDELTVIYDALEELTEEDRHGGLERERGYTVGKRDAVWTVRERVADEAKRRGCFYS